MSINPRLSIKTIVRDDEDTLSLSGAMAIAPYSYDKAGNNLNNSAVYNLLNNQLQQSALYTITYDGMGNIKTKYNKLNKTTSTYTFNARNQLIGYTKQDENNQTTKTLSFSYDAFGRRVSKTEDGVEQKYLYDGDDIVAILDSNNAVIATITHDESIDTPLSITNSNGTFYYHGDHQGSIIALTDSSGAVVESFTYDNHYGTIINHTKTVETNNPYAYTGRELDTDELYYYRARYYDPTLQRFLGEDPIGFDSKDFNFYRYVGNSPISFVDPSGEFLNFIASAIIGAGFDLFVQMVIEGKSWECVDKKSLLYAAGISAGITGLFKLGGFMKNGWQFFKQRGTVTMITPPKLVKEYGDSDNLISRLSKPT